MSDDIEKLKQENEMLREQAARAGQLARVLRKTLVHLPTTLRQDALKALSVTTGETEK